MIAVSLNDGGGVLLIKPAKLHVHVHAKHYKHNEDGRTVPGVCGNGSVPLSHSGNVVTEIGIHTHTYKVEEDGCTAPGVCGNGSVSLVSKLGHSGNVVTNWNTHSHTSLKQ